MTNKATQIKMRFYFWYFG